MILVKNILIEANVDILRKIVKDKQTYACKNERW